MTEKPVVRNLDISSAIQTEVVDDICFAVIDLYLKKHHFSVLDDRLVANLKGELDSIAVLRDIWLEQMQGSPEKLIELYEKTNDRKQVQHYENLIDSNLMNFAAEFFIALLAGILVEEYSRNRKKILDTVKKLYRKPIHKINAMASSTYLKYDRSLKYLLRAYALKNYSEKKKLAFSVFLSLRERIKLTVYFDKEVLLPDDLCRFEESFISLHDLPNFRESYAQTMGEELVKLSIDTNVDAHVKKIASVPNIVEPDILNFNEGSFEKKLKGIAAGKRGFATGKVVIVITYSDCGKVNKGDIMVVDEFCPDFVEAARRASALISNKGGLTSHTAIVGRALGLPTVVGAHIATKTLENGERVLVDSFKGIIYAKV
jgi:phosphohistidine swiveling domain-containing protein